MWGAQLDPVIAFSHPPATELGLGVLVDPLQLGMIWGHPADEF